MKELQTVALGSGRSSSSTSVTPTGSPTRSAGSWSWSGSPPSGGRLPDYRYLAGDRVGLPGALGRHLAPTPSPTLDARWGGCSACRRWPSASCSPTPLRRHRAPVAQWFRLICWSYALVAFLPLVPLLVDWDWLETPTDGAHPVATARALRPRSCFGRGGPTTARPGGDVRPLAARRPRRHARPSRRRRPWPVRPRPAKDAAPKQGVASGSSGSSAVERALVRRRREQSTLQAASVTRPEVGPRAGLPGPRGAEVDTMRWCPVRSASEPAPVRRRGRTCWTPPTSVTCTSSPPRWSRRAGPSSRRSARSREDADRLARPVADGRDAADASALGHRVARRFFALCENPRTRDRIMRMLQRSADSAVGGRLLVALLSRTVFRPAAALPAGRPRHRAQSSWRAPSWAGSRCCATSPGWSRSPRCRSTTSSRWSARPCRPRCARLTAAGPRTRGRRPAPER